MVPLTIWVVHWDKPGSMLMKLIRGIISRLVTQDKYYSSWVLGHGIVIIESVGSGDDFLCMIILC